MTVETTLLAGLSQSVDVNQIPRLMRCLPFEFTPRVYPNEKGHRNARGHGIFLRRPENATLLTLALRSEALSEPISMDSLYYWMQHNNKKAMFATIRIDNAVVATGNVYTVVVQHRMQMRGINEAHVNEVMTEIIKLWQDTMHYIDKLVYDEKICIAHSEAQKVMHVLKTPTRKTELELVQNEINALVGLADVKSFVQGLIAQRKVAELRVLNELPINVASPHLIFTGNPGTGKTTVARLVGRLYKSIGLLEKGHVVEVERGDLVGVYIGQTALKTKEACEKALGGVLFIDEAYSLDVDGRDYGSEVIETLLTFMEEHRGNFVVVAAGYPDLMKKFLHSNPGLNSRFDITVPFADYNANDLLTIFTNLATSKGYELSAGAQNDLHAVFNNMVMQEDHGNARDVRKIFNEVVAEHSKTLVTLAKPSKQQLQLITSLAIPAHLLGELTVSLNDLPTL